MPFSRNTRTIRTTTGEIYKDNEYNFTDGENYVMHSGWFTADRKIYRHQIIEDRHIKEYSTICCNQDVLVTVGLVLSGIVLFLLTISG